MTLSSPSSGERRILSPLGLPPQPLFVLIFFSYCFCCSLFFVYVQFTAGRQHCIENNGAVNEPTRRTSGSHLGQYIVVALVDLRIHNPESDVIILWIGSGSG